MSYTGYTVRTISVKAEGGDEPLAVIRLADEDSARRWLQHFRGESTASPERKNKHGIITVASVTTPGCKNDEERLAFLADHGVNVDPANLPGISFQEGTERFDTIDVYFANRRGKRIQAMTDRFAKGTASPEEILKMQATIASMTQEERTQFLKYMAGGK